MFMHYLPSVILLRNRLSCSNLEALLCLYTIIWYKYLQLIHMTNLGMQVSTLRPHARVHPAIHHAGAVAENHQTAPPASATVGRDLTAHAAEPASATRAADVGPAVATPQSATYGQAQEDATTSTLDETEQEDEVGSDLRGVLLEANQ